MPSKLEKLQFQFRQRLMQEKEERMIKIHNDNQQKALNKISKYNGHDNAISKAPPVLNAPQSHSPVKKNSPGVDRSRPLPPISKEGPNAEPENKNTTVSSVRSKFLTLESTKAKGNFKNGNSKLIDLETRHHVQDKPTQDVVASKQAELHRINNSSKIQEGAIPKKANGIKSSNSQASVTKFVTTQVSRTKTKPKTILPNSLKFDAKSSSSFQNLSKNKNNIGDNFNKNLVRKPPGPGQEQCKYCGRNFNQDRIEKHISICSKTSQKKVKVFDATKMRTKGTEAEAFVKRSLSKPVSKKPSNWRKQHAEFIETIRQAKMAQQFLAAGGNAKDLPPPPKSDTSHYIQCPHCNRKFNESAAERHIPKCKNILSNKKGPTITGARRR